MNMINELKEIAVTRLNMKIKKGLAVSKQQRGLALMAFKNQTERLGRRLGCTYGLPKCLNGVSI